MFLCMLHTLYFKQDYQCSIYRVVRPAVCQKAADAIFKAASAALAYTYNNYLVLFSDSRFHKLALC